MAPPATAPRAGERGGRSARARRRGDPRRGALLRRRTLSRPRRGRRGARRRGRADPVLPPRPRAPLHPGAPEQLAGLDRAYERRLLDQEGNEFFRAFRLKERGYPDDIRKPAATVLRMLAQSAEAIPLDTLRAA